MSNDRSPGSEHASSGYLQVLKRSKLKLQRNPSIYLSISTASPPLGDYVQVRVSAVLVEEMLLKIKSSHEIR